MFYKLDQFPPGFFRDEGAYAYDSLLIMRGQGAVSQGVLTPIYARSLTDNPAMTNYQLAAWYKFFGISVIKTRGFHAFMGVIGVIAMYFLLRLMFTPGTAFLGSLYYSFFYYIVVFNRMVFHAGLAPLYLIITLYFFYHAIRKPSYWNFILFGVCFGLNMHSYQAARATPLIFAVVLMLLTILRLDFMKAHYKKILAGLAVAFVIYFPLLQYTIDQKILFRKTDKYLIFSQEWMKPQIDEEISKKAKRLNLPPGSIPPLTAPENAYAYLKGYLKQASDTMLMFYNNGAPENYFSAPNIPMADFFTGLFAMMGFGYMIVLAIRGSFLSGATLFFFLALIHGGILFCCQFLSKSVLCTPFIPVFCAVYFFRAKSHMDLQLKTNAKNLLLTVFALITVIAFFSNYNKYFFQCGPNPGKYRVMESWRRGSAELYLKISREGAAKGEKWRGIFIRDLLLPESLVTLASDKNADYAPLVIGKTLPAPKGEGINYVYFTTAFTGDRPLIDAVKVFYPDAEVVNVYEPYNKDFLSFAACKVTSKQIDSFDPVSVRNGLRLHVYDPITKRTILSRVDPVIFNDEFYSGTNGAPFDAEWTGSIRIDETKDYKFELQGMGHLKYSLELDGKKVIVNDPERGLHAVQGTDRLTAGRHRIRISYIGSGNAWFYFMWFIPGNDLPELVGPARLYPD